MRHFSQARGRALNPGKPLGVVRETRLDKRESQRVHIHQVPVLAQGLLRAVEEQPIRLAEIGLQGAREFIKAAATQLFSHGHGTVACQSALVGGLERRSKILAASLVAKVDPVCGVHDVGIKRIGNLAKIQRLLVRSWRQSAPSGRLRRQGDMVRVQPARPAAATPARNLLRLICHRAAADSAV